MTILVIAEHTNAALAAATLNTVAAAQAIGGDIHVLVAGAACGAAAEAAAKVAGVAKVLVADNAAYAHQLPENVAPLVAELGKGYSHILAAATSNGKNILPRVAAQLDVDQISEIISVESADTFKRPIYAGNAIATVQSSAAIKVITVRTTGFDAVAAEPGVARGALPPYRVPNADVRFALARLPVFTGPWRGLGAGPNGLAIESAIDECARAAGADPVAFREAAAVCQRELDKLTAQTTLAARVH